MSNRRNNRRGRRGGAGRGGRRDLHADGNAPGGRCSRSLVQVLRHSAEELNLPIEPDGFVPLDAVLKTSQIRHYSPTMEEIQQMVTMCDKQRMKLEQRNGKWYIRANQGHSIRSVKTEDLLTKIENPDECPVCVHGTYMQHWGNIKAAGLNRMGRQQIHFAPGDKIKGEDKVTSGFRSSCNVLIYVDLAKAMADGIEFFRSSNDVILSEGNNGVIGPQYFKKVVRCHTEGRNRVMDEVLVGSDGEESKESLTAAQRSAYTYPHYSSIPSKRIFVTRRRRTGSEVFSEEDVLARGDKVYHKKTSEKRKPSTHRHSKTKRHNHSHSEKSSKSTHQKSSESTHSLHSQKASKSPHFQKSSKSHHKSPKSQKSPKSRHSRESPKITKHKSSHSQKSKKGRSKKKHKSLAVGGSKSVEKHGGKHKSSHPTRLKNEEDRYHKLSSSALR